MDDSELIWAKIGMVWPIFDRAIKESWFSAVRLRRHQRMGHISVQLKKYGMFYRSLDSRNHELQLLYKHYGVISNLGQSNNTIFEN